MKFKVVWTLKRGAISKDMDEEQSALAQAQIDREQGMIREHGVRIPAWSDDARVIWAKPVKLARSDESVSRVRRMVELTTGERVA